MVGKHSLWKAICLLLGFISFTSANSGQGLIYSDDVCQTRQGISDNLSCPRSDGVLLCYSRSELCNDHSFCLDGSDEGRDLNSLDCTGLFTGRTTPPIAAFVCSTGEIIELTQLCDGVRDCTTGDDETTHLCENKCFGKYYGGCPHTRECEYTSFNVSCGLCRTGYARDPADIHGNCLEALFSFDRTAYTVTEDAGSLTGAMTLDTAGELEAEVLIIVQIVIDGGTATDTEMDDTSSRTGYRDFTSMASTVTFPQYSGGNTSVSFSVPISEDFLEESSRTFQLIASIAANSSLGGRFSTGGDVATVNITNVVPQDPVFHFTQSVYAVNESSGMVQVVIELVKPTLSHDVEVVVSDISGRGNATVRLDYTQVVETLIFVTGSGPGTQITINISLTDDNLIEGQETFDLQATVSSPGLFQSGDNQTTVVIVDDDQLLVGYEFPSYGIVEGDHFQEVCLVVRNGDQLQAPVNVTVSSVEDGTAVDGKDFNATQSVLTFGPGTTRECWSIMIIDDSDVEGEECFLVNAVSQSPTTLDFQTDEDTAMVCIADTDLIEIGFSNASFPVREGSGPAVDVCVNLISGGLNANISIDVLTTETGTATAGYPPEGDYLPMSASLYFVAGTFAGGPGSLMCFQVPIIDDNLSELPETIAILISSIPDVQFPNGLESTVVIVDDDVPLFRFTNSSYSADEDVSHVQPAIELFSDVILTFSITVLVTDVSGGTADSGTDYGIVFIPLTFAPGSTSGTVHAFDVQIIDDLMGEIDETILLQASAGAPGKFPGKDQISITIIDNDQFRVGFEFPSYTVLEATIMQEVCLVKRNGVQADTSYQVEVFTSRTVINGATEGLDYKAFETCTKLTFEPGSTRACTMIQILGDTIDEPEECFRVNAQSSSPEIAIQTGESESTVCITDDDFAAVDFAFSKLSYNVTEGHGSNAKVCVDLVAGTLQRDVQILLSTMDGTAMSVHENMDYTSTSAILIFSAGTSPRSFRTRSCMWVAISDDTLVEMPENFHVFVSSSMHPEVMFPSGSSTTVSIEDNDIPLFRFTNEFYIVLESEEMFEARVRLREGTLTYPITVTITDLPGTATLDYSSGVSLTLEFPAGSVPKDRLSVSIPIVNDDLVEGEEEFLLKAVASAPGVFKNGRDEATVYILDDDRLVLGFESPTYDLVRDGSTLVLNQICLVQLNTAQLAIESVDVTISPKVDVFNDDTTVTFTPGSTRECVTNIRIQEEDIVGNCLTVTASYTGMDRLVTLERGQTTAELCKPPPVRGD